jgi:hypothetical protein
MKTNEEITNKEQENEEEEEYKGFVSIFAFILPE